MSWFYRHLIRPVLFTQNPEQIHNRTMHTLGWAGRHELVCDALQSFYGAPELPIQAFGLSFPNPIGLAAGMDKQAEALPTWAALGFGFTELGAVTWHAQPGNPSPRVFRAIPDDAIINRMGFNNPGAQAVAQTLAQWRALGRWPSHPVGMNLGKSKITPLDKAAEDYANSFRVLQPYLDFFVVNVSSPNTPNLRQLQDKSALDEIFAALQAIQPGSPAVAGVTSALPTRPTDNPGPKPILVKVAPDLSFEALDEILELVGPRQIAGIVATNTTITRPPEPAPELKSIYAELGGLSGRPLRARSTEVIRHLYRQTKGKLPIMGVGGIFSAADAWEKITAGASVVQVYTGMVYEGPGVAKSIVAGLLEHLEQAGLRHLSQAVGLAER
ncbi:MAG TPA: quinone-dependent dihydroorotate dehydrogenase [Candidatus Sulfotelmatobacter sp.]|nr:quinone-dependent dihydroorotate dehydrogenase [Candidatus Sulfotelmatobacter sp.]HWI59994.1 quinone-dependent dihydroorotate dehydrogenase [Bacillota bacterium]